MRLVFAVLVALVAIVLTAGCVSQSANLPDENNLPNDSVNVPFGSPDENASAENAVCGNGICDAGETADCCIDCGCPDRYECIGNTCTEVMQLTLIDDATKCMLDGVAYPSMKTSYYPDFPSNVVDGIAQLPKLENVTSVYLYTNLTECFKQYKDFSLIRIADIVNGSDTVYFDISPDVPLFISELSNFVRPADVMWYVDANRQYIDESKSIEDRLKKWFSLLEIRINYIFDRGETWDTPNKTLMQFNGDCEEFSTTFLSVIKAYNSSLKCFNVDVPSHLTTLCKFNNGQYDYFYFYDQGQTAVTSNFWNANTVAEKRSTLLRLVSDYFRTYDLTNTRNLHIGYVFDDKNVYTFETDEEMFDWLIRV